MASICGDLSKSKALVTGSTSGIGLGMAIALAAKGCSVCLNGFGDVEAALAQVRAAAAGTTAEITFHGADLSKVEEIEDMIKQAGDIDILVNNAGIQNVAPIEEQGAKWDKVIAINLSAVFHTTRLVLPSMKAKNYGRIINIASVHGLCASANKSPYVAAKHGVVGLTKVTALETAKFNITCNAICPGWVLTPLVEAQIEERVKAKPGTTFEAEKTALLIERQPSGNFVLPSDLAAMVLFLVSDAAKEMRGTALNMDGGWMCL